MITEFDIRRFLFIRALEETAKPGEVQSAAADAHLASEADRANPDIVRIALDRSKYVEQDLARRWAVSLESIYSRSLAVSGGMVFIVVAVAFLLGITSNYFGGDNINLLLNPFLLLLAWNALIYILLLARRIVTSLWNVRIDSAWGSWIVSAITMVLNRIGKGKRYFSTARKKSAIESIIGAQPVYVKLLIKSFGKLYFCRVSLLLHLAAMSFVIGVIAGMYARGLTQFYGVFWESTFIGNAGDVSGFLHMIFGPVRILFNVPLPPVMATPARVYSFGSEWIHFYSLAAVLYIIIPRAILAIGQALGIRKQKQSIAIDPNDPYIHSLVKQYQGRNLTLHPMLYGYSIADETGELLDDFLSEVFGRKAVARPVNKIEWGTKFSVECDQNSDHAVIVVFNGAQTPEDEIHGYFAEDLVSWVNESRSGVRLLLLVDFSQFQEDRFHERRQLWQTVFTKFGARSFVSIAPGQQLSDQSLINDALAAIVQTK